MIKMSYEQNQILALRTAVQMITAVLNDDQKEMLKMMLDEPQENMTGIVPEEHIAEAKNILANARDILHLD